MYNFSAQGLYFESNEDLLKGDEISISIKEPPPQLKKDSDRYIDVRIMWARDLQDSSYEVGYGAMLI